MPTSPPGVPVPMSPYPSHLTERDRIQLEIEEAEKALLRLKSLRPIPFLRSTARLERERARIEKVLERLKEYQRSTEEPTASSLQPS
jgi:hypothetical protein